MSASADLSRALQGRETVKTHVYHIVSERHDGAVTTECGYYLKPFQHEGVLDWSQTPITMTGICHHCARELREGGQKSAEQEEA